jgi:FixJ family two-component response regulator
MAEPSPWIAIVDDDPSVLKALTRLLRARPPGKDLPIGAGVPGGPAGQITRMPDPRPADAGDERLELLQHLTRSGIRIPTIIITAHGDAGVRERCESAGAIAFLAKPLQDTSLFAAIDDASKSARDRRDGLS